MADFERLCHKGKVICRAEKKEGDLQQKREAAKIQTLKEYGEEVFTSTGPAEDFSRKADKPQSRKPEQIKGRAVWGTAPAQRPNQGAGLGLS